MSTTPKIQIRFLKKRDLFFKVDGPSILIPFYTAAFSISIQVDERFQFAPFLLAGFLHAFLLLAQQWFVGLRCKIEFQTVSVSEKERATHVFVIEEEDKKIDTQTTTSFFSSSSKGAIAEIRRVDGTGKAIKGSTKESEELLKLKTFTFVYHSLCYEIIEDFLNNSGIIYACPANLPDNFQLDYFLKWKRLGWRVDEVTRATMRYGPNRLDVPIPTFYKLFQEHAVAPLFVFQIFSVCLWLLDEHPWSSLYTLAMLIFAEGAQVMMRIQTAKQLRGMRPPSQRVKVFRSSKWTEINSDDLVPLDVVSISRKQNTAIMLDPKKAPTAAAAEQQLASSSFCPADIVLIGGSVIVNEAMLTGESTPQMKESISTLDSEDLLGGSGGGGVQLNAFTEASDRSHSRCVVFGGTQIVQHTVDPEWKESDGAVGIVIRTGARTSQGELMRTIMHTLEPGNIGSQKEAYIFLLGLLVCAVSASAYVLYHGLADSKRDRWELILHCVMLITIVVPPELPITLSMAVNNAITTLRKSNIFCTDPARIPLGGMVTTVAFDKTGTLTSDEFIVEGVVHPFDDDSIHLIQSVQDASVAPVTSQLVLAGCHALALVPGNGGPSSQPELLGDAIEKVALRAINWTLLGDGKSSTPVNSLSSKPPGPLITVLRRWAFSSSLKRMTTIARVSFMKGLAASSDVSIFVLCKGAPEVLETLLEKVPKNYKSVHEKMSSGGSRVLALAYKPLQSGRTETEIGSFDRNEAEKNMIFAGFLSVSSPLKTDSMRTVRELQESNHRVIMITGDAPLTAIAVARMLNIGTYIDNKQNQKSKIFEDISEASSNISNILSSLKRADSSQDSTLGCVTGRFLEAFDRSHTAAETAQLCRQISIFARVSPSQKERVIQLLNDFCGEHTAMVGDGSNDTGALKRSNVGIAVISNPAAERQFDVSRLKTHQKWINDLRILEDEKRKFPANSLQYRVAELKLEAASKKKAFDEDELEALLASPAARTAGSGGNLLLDEDIQLTEQKTQTPSPPQSLEERLKALEAELNAESSDGLINLGDASMAAPFTSKLPTAYSVVDILRQGRCTHVTTHQSFKIMAVSSLVSCYMYSVLFLKGVKLADEQHMAGGIILSALNMLVSFAKPVAKLSKERPQLSSLTPGTLLSIIGQFAVHLSAMLLVNFYIAPDPLAIKAALESSSSLLANATLNATDAVMSASEDLMVSLSDAASQLLQTKLAGDSSSIPGASPTATAELGIFNTTPFIPSKLVSAVFLVSTVSQACTYLVCYRGEPFMEPMTLGSYLGRTAMFVYFAAAIAALGLSDDLNKMLNIIPLDEWNQRLGLFGLILLDGILCWTIESFFRMKESQNERKKIDIVH